MTGLIRHWIAECTVMGQRHVEVISDTQVPDYVHPPWKLSGPFVLEAQHCSPKCAPVSPPTGGSNRESFPP